MTAVMNQSPSSSPSPKSPRQSHHASSSLTDTDWRTKYIEVTELLNETRAELDDFTRTSKELEEELERDLERTEKAQEELRKRVSKLEGERDDWKIKFMNLQHTHNATSNSLQRELDATRQSVQLYKDQVRELEMGNDDLERNERQATSSLADVEQKYARALEEKILLEHELQDKVVIEETCQRLRDELRDVNLEVAVLKDQVHQMKILPERPHTIHRESTPSLPFTPPVANEESLLQQEALDFGMPDPLPSPLSTPPLSMNSLHSRLSREVCPDDHLPASPVSLSSSRPGSTLYRERPTVTTTPTQPNFFQRALSPTASSGASPPSTRLPAPRTRWQSPNDRQPSGAGTPRMPVRLTAPRSRGVQMVSDMRARVRTLERKIGSNLPRIPSIPSTGAVIKRAPSRTGLGSAAHVLNDQTPKRTLTGASKAPSSPWVLVGDDGVGNMTLRGPPSPEPAPRLSPVPSFSPFTTTSVGEFILDTSTTLNRTSSRSSGLRSLSALGRPIAALSSTVSTSGVRRPVAPPTAFPSSLMGQQDPSSSSSPVHGPSSLNRPRSRIAQSTSLDDPRRSSDQRELCRPITPTLTASKGNPAIAGLVKRAHTLSSPTRPGHLPPSSSKIPPVSPSKPRAHLTAGVLPRQRKDSTKAHLPSAVNTRDAGVTPGRIKQRSATSPQRPPPPPLPALPIDYEGRVGKPKLSNRPGTGRPGIPSLGASRIGRYSGGGCGRRSAEPELGNESDEDLTVRLVRPHRARSGTNPRGSELA